MLISTFLKVLDLSRAASIVIVLVMLARLLLRRAPKVFSYGLWAAVLVRLLCPLELESPVSLIPRVEPVAQHYTLAEVPITPVDAGSAALEAVGDALNGGLGIQQIQTAIPDGSGGMEQVSTLWWEVWVLAGQYLWLAGMAVMALYAVVSYGKLRRKLDTASLLEQNIWLADGITSPFVLGLLFPRIYLPSDLPQRERSYILLHERHHIRRLDHIFKALGFLALTIHWFNPLVWVAFLLASKDMEMSCDEAVVRKLGEGIRADYAASLLSLATGKHIIAGTPLAFGEGDTGGRIRNLARWHKPRFWVTALALVLCAVLVVGLLTNPVATRNFSLDGENVRYLDAQKTVDTIAEICGIRDSDALRTNGDNFELYLTGDFTWNHDQSIRFFYSKGEATQSAQLRIFPQDRELLVTEAQDWPEQQSSFLLRDYLQAVTLLPQEEIRELVPEADLYLITLVEEGQLESYAHSLHYNKHGLQEEGGWLIHLRLDPMTENEDGSYSGTGADSIHLFYGDSSTEDSWPMSLSASKLEAGATVYSEEEYVLAEGGMTLTYDVAYSSPDSMLQVGLAAEDGSEYEAVVTHGSGQGNIQNIPAGTYRLFVRNAETSGRAMTVCTLKARLSARKTWAITLSAADLAPGERVLSDEEFLIARSGAILTYEVSYDQPDCVLEIGLTANYNASYATVQNGQTGGSICVNTPGTYRLFVRNANDAEDLPDVTVDVCILRANLKSISDVPAPEEGTYVSNQCLYMNPYAATVPQPADSGYRYTVGPDYFAIEKRDSQAGEDIRRIPVDRWKWEVFEYTKMDWDSLEIVPGFTPTMPPFPKGALYQELTNTEFLLHVDGELWLVTLQPEQKTGTYLGSIYSLVPEEG